MNKKIFLTIIILSTLLFSTFFPIIEGACSYEDGGSISNRSSSSSSSLGRNNEAPIVGRTKNSCQTAGIYRNSRNLKDVENKLNELTKIANSVESKVKKNEKGVNKNTRNRKMIQSLTDDSVEAEGNDDMCKDYPSSCKETKLPKRISGNEYNRIMSRR